jgi:hypothetical protein
MQKRIAECRWHVRPQLGVHWWLSDPSWAPVCEDASRHIINPNLIATEALLKMGRRRLVFTTTTSDQQPSAVVKAFPADDLARRFNNKKYAFSEAANLIQASRLGVPVPTVAGWGQCRFRRRAWSAVLMERITGDSFADLIISHRADSDILQRCVQLLLRLYQTGVNLIDLRADALFFGADESADRIIDFQYCSFRPKPSLTTFLAQIGHFLYWWENQLSRSDAMEEWLSRMISTLHALESVAISELDLRAHLDRNRAQLKSSSTRLFQ